MIGNWVYLDGDSKYPVRVEAVYTDYVFLQPNAEGFEIFSARRDGIGPIPLTEEMLLKNGFDNVKGSLYVSNGDFEIYIKGGLLYMAKSDGSDIAFQKPIKYVHELQNILNVAGIDFDFKI